MYTLLAKKGENTGSTQIVLVLCVCVPACQPRLLSRPVVQDAGWHRSTILRDVTIYHGIQFINSMCGLIVEGWFGAQMPCHEVELIGWFVSIIDSQVEIWMNISPV